MRVLANSIPKAGTHLLKRCLNLISGVTDTDIHVDYLTPKEEIKQILAAVPPSHFVSSHLTPEPWLLRSLEHGGYVVLLMIRDPRDIVVSYIHYVLKEQTHFLHQRFSQMEDLNERLMATILGIQENEQLLLLDIDSLCRGFLQWQGYEICRTIRFEDLIGPMGGGTSARQHEAVASVADHIGISMDSKTASEVSDKIFDPKSPTFRKGTIGSWKDEFTPEAARQMDRLAAELLSLLGYTREAEWQRLCERP